MSNETSVKQRQSGIELLKIIAMFLIVISHCAQSMIGSENFILSNINIEQPTTDHTIFILYFFRHLGVLGNTVFLLSSVWFLVDNKNLKLNKIANMVLNVYVISVIFLLIFLTMGVDIFVEDILKCLFPTTFSLNWYITCYLLLYSIYPLLNTVINKLTQKQHLAYNCVFFILYFLIGSIRESFYVNELICFIIIYFIAAYIKKYNLKLISNQNINLIFLFAGIFLFVLLLLAMNLAVSHISAAGQHMFHFANNHNPIIFIIAFSMFNIFRNLKIQFNAINYISSLTLFIYIIHENFLFRKYLRPALLFSFWETSGRMNVALFSLICSLILLIASALAAMLYNKTLQPIVEKTADKILQIFLKLYGKFESFMLKIE